MIYLGTAASLTGTKRHYAVREDRRVRLDCRSNIGQGQTFIADDTKVTCLTCQKHGPNLYRNAWTWEQEETQ